MRKIWLVTLATGLALVWSGVPLVTGVSAEMTEQTTTTTKTTSYSGTVSAIDPGSSTITLRTESPGAPTKYTFTKETIFTDPQGHVVSYDAIRDTPVTVFYSRDGDRMVVTKVVTTKPLEKKTEVHHETTTETHELN